MQCPAQAAFDGIERSQAEGPQRASVGLSWARGKGSRAQALFGHEPSRAWARLVQSLVNPHWLSLKAHSVRGLIMLHTGFLSEIGTKLRD